MVICVHYLNLGKMTGVSTTIDQYTSIKVAGLFDGVRLAPLASENLVLQIGSVTSANYVTGVSTYISLDFP